MNKGSSPSACREAGQMNSSWLGKRRARRGGRGRGRCRGRRRSSPGRRRRGAAPPPPRRTGRTSRRLAFVRAPLARDHGAQLPRGEKRPGQRVLEREKAVDLHALVGLEPRNELLVALAPAGERIARVGKRHHPLETVILAS